MSMLLRVENMAANRIVQRRKDVCLPQQPDHDHRGQPASGHQRSEREAQAGGESAADP